MKDPRYQNGSVLFYILIAVVLFAALSYSVAQMMRSGNPGTISEEKALLFADEILDYGRAVRQSVQAIKISNGCTDTQISFENSFVTGYTHTPAASTGCRIFDTAGGNLQYIIPNDDWLDPAFSADGAYKKYLMTGVNAFETVGSASPDLIVALPYVKSAICEAINRKLGVTAVGDAMPADGVTGSSAKFTGTYTASETPGAAAGGAAIRGKLAGCLEDTSGGTKYVYYQVLIAR